MTTFRIFGTDEEHAEPCRHCHKLMTMMWETYDGTEDNPINYQAGCNFCGKKREIFCDYCNKSVDRIVMDERGLWQCKPCNKSLRMIGKTQLTIT